MRQSVNDADGQNRTRRQLQAEKSSGEARKARSAIRSAPDSGQLQIRQGMILFPPMSFPLQPTSIQFCRKESLRGDPVDESSSEAPALDVETRAGSKAAAGETQLVSIYKWRRTTLPWISAITEPGHQGDPSATATDCS